jgi:transposase-like protein
VTQKFGIGSAETLRNWFRRDEIDSGQRPGTTTEESAAMKTLKKETAELKRANEILRAAALDSTGQGNALGWCAESQALARTVVELRRDGVKIVLAERRQVRAFGQVLPEQLVGVLVGATLPGAAKNTSTPVSAVSRL